MRIRHRVIAVLALGLALVRPGYAHDAHLQGVAVEGDVVDAATGRPVAAAAVALVSPDAASPQGVTDASGHFVIKGVASGAYRVVVTRAGYLDGAFGRARPHGTERLLFVPSETSPAPLLVRLWRPSAIAGVVRHDDNEPLPDTPVHLLRRSMWTDGWQVDGRVSSAETDGQGRYRFDDLEPGEYVVAVLPPASPAVGGRISVPTFFPGVADLSAAAPVRVDAGDTNVQVDVRVLSVPSVSVDGRLVGPAGALANSRVDIYRRDKAGRLPELVVASTISASDGSFRFAAVPTGSFVVEAVTEGGDTGRGAPFWGQQLCDVANRDVTDVAVTMQPSFTVSGRVVFDGSSPPGQEERGRVSIALQAVSTDLVWSQERDPRVSSGSVDDDGRFTIAGIPPGSYVVLRAQGFGRWTVAQALMGGVDAADHAVAVGPSTATDLVVTLSDRPAQLSGDVRTSSGVPAEGQWVLLFAADRQSWHPFSRRTRTALLGPEATYVFDDLPSGDYYLVVTDDVDFASMGPSLFDSFVAGALRVRLNTGETKMQSLTGR